jgi:VanZ family protein
VLVLLGFLKYMRFRDLAGFVLGLLILGALDEITQPYIGRTCDLYDWLADLSGVVSGTILLAVLFRIQRGRIFNG